jgi:hypothetical protein
MTHNRAGTRRAKKENGQNREKENPKNRYETEDRMETYDKTVNRKEDRTK